MGKHLVHVRTFTVGVVVLLLLCGLAFAAYFDITDPVCVPDARGMARGNPLHSLLQFRTSFGALFKCHMLDVVAWLYVLFFVLLIGRKWWDYGPTAVEQEQEAKMNKNEQQRPQQDKQESEPNSPTSPTSPAQVKYVSHRRFLLDFCYFLNVVMIFLIIIISVHVRGSSGSSLFGLAVPEVSGEEQAGIPIPLTGFRIDVAPIPVGIAQLRVEWRRAVLFVFVSLLGGSLGAILWAVLVWGNSLSFHDHDRLSSCYLHLAVPTVQVLMLASAFLAVADDDPRRTLTSDLLFNKALTFKFLLISHLVMFVAWQVLQNLFLFVRFLMRRGKPDDGIERISAFSWMMEKPPGGKNGPLFKIATIFGKGIGARIMFVLIQVVSHIIFLSIGFVPLWISKQLNNGRGDVGPLLLYVFMFVVIAVRNGALLLKRWIQKLEARAEKAEAELMKLKKSA